MRSPDGTHVKICAIMWDPRVALQALRSEKCLNLATIGLRRNGAESFQAKGRKTESSSSIYARSPLQFIVDSTPRRTLH